MPRFLRVVSWLCLLLCGAVATTVEDGDAAIHYDTTWTLDENGTNSGGSAHHTNISGGTATYWFAGEFGAQGALFEMRPTRNRGSMSNPPPPF
jgi:hypothetical protein